MAGGGAEAELLRDLMLLLALALPAHAQDREPVDLELLLLADAASLIDAVEMAIQRHGYASAMIDPEVISAIRNGGEHGRIAVAYVEWAKARRQDVVVDWMVIDGVVAGRISRDGCSWRRGGLAASTRSARR